MTSSSASPTTSTTISSTTVRMIRLRVPGVTPGLLDPPLARLHGGQPCIPAPLQFARDEPVLGVDGVVLPLRERRLVTRLLQGVLQLTPSVVAFPPPLRDGGERRLHAEGLQPAEHLRRHGAIGPHAAEAGAAGRRQLAEGAGADVALRRPSGAGVGDLQPAPAPGASEQARQQGLAAPRGTATQTALAVGVLRHEPLIALVLRPADVA